MLKERLPEVFVHLHRIPEQRVGFSGLYHWKTRAAETVRITPSTNLGAAVGKSSTKSPSATTLITDPTPIGVTVWVRLRRHLTDYTPKYQKKAYKADILTNGRA